MAEGRIKGITIEIDGDVTGLNKALESTTKELRSTQKQLNDVNRLLKLDPTNTELLSQKQRLLGDAIKSTQSKLETMKKAQEQAAAKLESGGKEAQEQYEALRREIISTENYLGKLEGQAEDTEKALDDAGNNGAGSIEEAGDAAKDAESKVSGFGSAAKAAGVVAAAAFAAATAAAVAAAKALVNMTVGGAEYADNVLTMSAQTGIATDKLQEYMYAAELVDVSTETLTKSMAKNIKSMKSAADGSASYAEAYEQLGVSVVDANGSLRDSETVYWEAVEALGKIENETERDAIAMQLFGKSAQDLNPLIEAGAERMQELGEEAQNAGYVLSNDMLAAYGALDDNLQYLKVNAEGAKNALGTVLLPVLTELSGTGVDLLAKFSKGISGANGDIGKMSDVIGEILPKALDAVMEYVPELLEVIGAIIGAFGRAIVDNLPAIVESASQIILSILDGLIAGLPQIAGGALQLIFALIDGIVVNLPALIEAAAQVIVTIATGIAEALPVLAPTLVQVVEQIAQTLIDNLPLILDAALALIEGLAHGILDAIPVLIAALPKVINGIIKFLLDSVPKIINTGIRLLTALVDALPEIIDAIVAVLPQIIDGIIGALMDAIPQIVQAGIDLLISLVKALPKIITTIARAIPKIISGIVNAIIGNIDKIIEAGVQLFVALVANLPTIIAEIVKAVPQIIGAIAEAFGSGFGVACEPVYKLSEAEEEIIQKAKDAKESYEDLQKTFRSDVDAIMEETKRVEDLWRELQTLADENGNVEEANRNRANYILGELSTATGEEWEMIDGTIQRYDDLTNSIEATIKAKKAEKLVEAGEESYNTAKTNYDESLDALEILDTQIKAQEQAVAEAEQKLEDYELANADKLASHSARSSLEWATWGSLQQTAESSREALEELEAEYEEANKTTAKYYEDIYYYEQAQEALLSGNYDEAIELMTRDTAYRWNNLAEKRKITKEELSDLKKDYESALFVAENYRKNYEDGMVGYTAEGLHEAESAAAELGRIWAEAAGDAVVSGRNIAKGLARGIKDSVTDVDNSAGLVAKTALNRIKNVAQIASPSKVTTSYGKYIDDGLIVGLKLKMQDVSRAASQIADAVLASVDPSLDLSGSAGSPTAWYVPAQQQSSTVYNNSTSLGGITVYVDAKNVDNVEDLAELVADKINTDIINRQAVSK